MAIKPNYQKDGDNVVTVQTSKDPIEQQILAAGNLSEAQVEAIRGFQRRKGRCHVWMSPADQGLFSALR